MRSARRISRQVDRRLEVASLGWSFASYDPNLLLDAFPCLQIRDGFQLAAYQFYDGGNGNGFVFAIPDCRTLPDPKEDGFSIDWSSAGIPVFLSADEPLPDWVNPNIGFFLEGDGSPLSHFQSSIFIRELHEMGTSWHGCSWSTHEVLISAIPIAKQNWKWRDAKPEDWRPVVCRNSDGLWQVNFFSHTGLGQEQIVAHRDTFTAGYQFDADDKVIALGEGGYVF